MKFPFEMFKMFLEFMWPPYLIQFFRTWREPCSGQGLGPGLYKLFLPIYFTFAFAALATDIAIVAGIIYLATHHVSIR